MKKEEANISQFNVTDIVELNETLWSYKITTVDFYSSNYVSLQRMIQNQEYQDSLIRKELFRKAKN